MGVRVKLPGVADWKDQVKCQTGCPVATDAGRYVQLIAERRDEVRVLVPALGDQLDVAARIGRHRAAGLTLDLGLPVFQTRDPGSDGHGPTSWHGEGSAGVGEPR